MFSIIENTSCTKIHYHEYHIMVKMDINLPKIRNKHEKDIRIYRGEENIIITFI